MAGLVTINSEITPINIALVDTVNQIHQTYCQNFEVCSSHIREDDVVPPPPLF